MIPLSLYDKLLKMAELEHLWGREREVCKILYEEGYYVKREEPDGKPILPYKNRTYLMTISDQISFLKSLKEQFEYNKKIKRLPEDGLFRP